MEMNLSNCSSISSFVHALKFILSNLLFLRQLKDFIYFCVNSKILYQFLIDYTIIILDHIKYHVSLLNQVLVLSLVVKCSAIETFTLRSRTDRV